MHDDHQHAYGVALLLIAQLGVEQRLVDEVKEHLQVRLAVEGAVDDVVRPTRKSAQETRLDRQVAVNDGEEVGDVVHGRVLDEEEEVREQLPQH